MTDAEQVLLDEIQHLRAELAKLNRVSVSHAAVRHSWLKLIIRDLETNPHTQYKVHWWGVIYWLINFPLVTCLFLFAPGIWDEVGIFITLIYSIYANFATDYGAMSAAMAAYNGEHLPEIPLEQ